MARTWLAGQVREHIQMVGEALRRNVTVEQVLAERKRAGILRRELLQRELEYGGVDIAPQPVQSLVAASGTSKARIVIVGAGLAGLTCAYRLQQAGVQAVLYEAAERPGGRCFTCRNVFDEGQTAEHGGEFIDKGHKQIRHLAEELGLTLDNLLQAEQNGTEPVYYIDGDHYTCEEVTADIKKFWPNMQEDLTAAGYPTLYHTYTKRGYELDHMSVHDWINEYVPGGSNSRIGKLLDIAYNIEYGEESSEHSSLNLLYLLGNDGQGQMKMFGPSMEKYRVRGGNDLIVQGLVTRLSGRIETGTELIAIKRNSDNTYTLTFSRGQGIEEVQADKVVLTLPFSTLRKVDYSKAGFRELKTLAIQEQGMGTNTKLQLQFHERHWRKLGFNGGTYGNTGYQSTWEVTRAQAGRAGILNNFTGGKVGASFGQGTLQEHAERFLKQIEPVFPGISATWNHKALLDDWTSNRLIRGSFAHWKVGQYTKFAGVEGEREGNCHFAGEHTSVVYQGYLNGAVETGERAAREILADPHIRQ